MAKAEELERIGVARVSTAAGPATAAMEKIANIAQSLFSTGDFNSYSSTLKRPDIQALFSKKTEER
jgi:2-methylisocitrate lyase-like PEP mutase family enzyme